MPHLVVEMKKNRGRPPKYPELIVLQKRAHSFLKFQDLENKHEEIYIAEREGTPIRGCNLSRFAKPHEDAWVVKFSFSGQQYTIATLPLYDACCLYDCLLVWFAPFRRQRPEVEESGWFNFGAETANFHLETNDTLKDFLTDLESFFKGLGVLKTKEERAARRNDLEQARKARGSIRGVIDEHCGDVKEMFNTILDEIDLLKATVKSLKPQ